MPKRASPWTSAAAAGPDARPAKAAKATTHAPPRKQLALAPGWTTISPNCTLGYFPRCQPAPFQPRPWPRPPPTTTQLPSLQDVLAEVAFSQQSVRIYGRWVPQPRLVAYMADPDAGGGGDYTYSGLTMQSTPWTPSVLAVKRHVEAVAGTRFNSCLLNCYRSGEDHVSWHADDERLYGDEPTIASFSLGATRDFVLKPRQAAAASGGGAGGLASAGSGRGSGGRSATAATAATRQGGASGGGSGSNRVEGAAAGGVAGGSRGDGGSSSSSGCVVGSGQGPLGAAGRACGLQELDQDVGEVQPRCRPVAEKVVCSLQEGDVLVMRGRTQQHWLHSLPKRRGAVGPRVSLTFRQIVVLGSST